MTTSGKSPAEHAVLSPSSAERWSTCPASVRMAATMPASTGESSYALEGTCAHALGEIEARLQFGYITPAEHVRERNAWRVEWQERIGLTEEQEEEMSTHIAGYISLLVERANLHPHTVVLLEQRMNTGVPGCWGTSDAVLVSPVHVEIVDLKYGIGVRVEAAGNPQLRLYGIGGLETFGDVLGGVVTVTVTVYQPRLNHTVSETLQADDLRAWRDSLIPIAEEALGENARFGPSDEACRWCPASGQCRAQLEWVTATDFGPVDDFLSPAELAEALALVPAIQAWCNDVKAAGLERAYNQQEKIPGFKVVRSNGRRTFPDEQGAIDALLEAGHPLAKISTRKIKGLGELEKVLSKPVFDAILTPFIVKTTGAPSLVPEDDKRSPIDRISEAAEEFGELA